MTRERISKLSGSDLVKLAEVFSIDPYEDFDIDENNHENIDPLIRKELEAQVFEVIEEVRLERQGSDALPVQYHQKHFLSIEEFFGQKIEDESSFFSFPDHYNVTRVMLMLRDPDWAFTYWDISSQDRAEILQRADFRTFLIILQEFPETLGRSSSEQNNDDIVDMEIPVQISDNSRYINLPHRGGDYCVELAVQYRDRQEVLARSGAIHIPNGRFSAKFDSVNARKAQMLFALSGIEDLEVSGYGAVPRKIVEILDIGNE